MDEQTQKATDAVADDELAKGFRVKQVPEYVNKALREEGLPALTYLRFMRLNPSRRRKVAETVQRAYHRDLKNNDVLSTAQLLRLAKEREEWSDELEHELADLKEKVADAQRVLYLDGVKGSNWLTDFERAIADLETMVFAGADETPSDDARTYMRVLTRWATFNAEDQERYDKEYAAAQSRETYSLDMDFDFVMQNAPGIDGRKLIEDIEDLKDKLKRFNDFVGERDRRDELMQRFARIMSESAESRRENTQAMANVYFCVAQSDTEGTPGLPITNTFDDFWSFPDPVVQWLIDEYYFFANNIPETSRDFLETFGFLPATPAPKSGAGGESPASDVSPEATTDKPDSTASTETPSPSSESVTATTSTKSS